MGHFEIPCNTVETLNCLVICYLKSFICTWIGNLRYIIGCSDPVQPSSLTTMFGTLMQGKPSQIVHIIIQFNCFKGFI